MMWMRTVKPHAAGMRTLNAKEVEEAVENLFKLGSTVRELPYSNLRKAAKHEYAAVKS